MVQKQSIVRFKVNIVSWNKDTTEYSYSCLSNINGQDLLDELSGLSYGFEFRSVSFWIDKKWHLVLAHQKLSELNLSPCDDGVISLYSESYLPGDQHPPGKESMWLYQLSGPHQRVPYLVTNLTLKGDGYHIPEDDKTIYMYPGWSIQHAYSVCFMAWNDCEGMLPDYMLYCLGAEIMVSHGNFSNIRFNTRQFRDYRLCDLECTSGDIRGRHMFFCFKIDPRKRPRAQKPKAKRQRIILETCRGYETTGCLNSDSEEYKEEEKDEEEEDEEEEDEADEKE
jgi:hypothetical protein